MSSSTADGAEVLRVRGEFEGTNSLTVYYAAFETTFRARLQPVADGRALELSDLSEVDLPEDEDSYQYDEATVVHRFDLSTQVAHVPPVVREAVLRPVQVALGDDE